MKVNRSVLAKFGTAIKKFLRNVRGVILIEFAVGMPLLLMLLFGMHDIFKMAQMKDKTNFIAHLVVHMIQNVSQARKDKKITLRDLTDISRFAGYVIYPGTTQYAISDYNHFYGHTPKVIVYYVRGESGGKASVLWKSNSYAFTRNENTSSSKKIGTVLTAVPWLNPDELVKRQTNAVPSKIYPKLTIAEGEVKIIVEVYLCKYNAGDYPDALLTANEAFGTYLLTPSTNRYGFFNSVVIFTPRRGLFDEAGPK